MASISQPSSRLQSLLLKTKVDKGFSSCQIVTSMGYSNKAIDKAIIRLQNILSESELGLTKSRYGFKYSSIEFLQRLCQVLDIYDGVSQPLIIELEQYADNFLNSIVPIVMADIEFNDNFRPSFMGFMSVSRFKRVALYEDTRLLDRPQQMKDINQLIKEHSLSMQGKIPFDGIIKGYTIIFNYGTESSEYIYIQKNELMQVV